MKRRILSDTIRKNKNIIILFIIMTLVNLSVFLLYRIMTEAFWYAETIILVAMIILIVIDFFKNLRHAQALEAAKYAISNENCDLPPAETFSEEQYCEMIEAIIRKSDALRLTSEAEKQDMNDWYTLWVHQIKTPIAVLKLKLSENEKEAAELFRIEEYANMALSYIRLGSTSNDLVIREYPLDEIIKETLRKYAPQFIAKKIRLEYDSTAATVITDKKWFQCIFEQLISNAVKYTDSGSVKVTVGEDYLSVSDTGIGIPADDLPRIFEKGYTGNNGRAGAGSSGLGLYLSAKAAKMIGITLLADSNGGGSCFQMIFPKKII